MRYIVLALITSFLLISSMPAIADTVIGNAVRDVTVLPGPRAKKLLDKDRLREIEASLRRKAVKKRRRYIKKVELMRVTPKWGNNPLNTQDPVRNTFQNGQVLYRAVDEQETTPTPGPSPAPGGCTGSDLCNCIKNVQMHVVVPGPPTTIWGANFDIDPCTLKCLTPPPGVAGQGDFSVTYAPGDAANTMYCAGSAADPNSEWKLQAGGFCNTYVHVPGQAVEFIAVSNKGRLLKVRFHVSTPVGSPPIFMLLSLTPLN